MCFDCYAFRVNRVGKALAVGVVASIAVAFGSQVPLASAQSGGGDVKATSSVSTPQDVQPWAAGQLSGLKTVVVEPSAKSSSEVAIPPFTSVSVKVALNAGAAASADRSTNLPEWLQKAGALNSIQSDGIQPWHIVIRFDQFDEDGDNINSGTFEELWAGPKRYKLSYKSDKLNQTDYANDKGLFRVGDQRWPNRAEMQVRNEVVDPFSYARTLTNFAAVDTHRVVSGAEFDCVLLEGPVKVSEPSRYCFEPGGSILRYSLGWGWDQTTYNDIAPFHGRNLAHSVNVYNGGKPYLRMSVETVEPLTTADDAQFNAPPDATSLSGKPVSGVMVRPIKLVPPEFPSSFRGQSFTIQVEILIGKDGHVKSAHAVSGPPEAQKYCENAIKKWVYQPYNLAGEPVEVEERAGCDHH